MSWTKTGTLPAKVITDADVEDKINHGTLTPAALAANQLAGLTTSGARRDAVDARVGAGITGKQDVGDAFYNIGRAAGVDPTGAAECAAAIQTAITAASGFGYRAYAKGTFKIASTIVIKDNIDFGEATFNYTGTSGVAFQLGETSASFISTKTIRLPRQITATAKTVTGWSQVAGTIGVLISNCYSCDITIPWVRSFETSLQVQGANGQGSGYNRIMLGQLDNGKVNHRITAADATGWSNQNSYFAGRMSHNSSEGSQVPGTRHVVVESLTLQSDNNNWYGTSLESADVVEYHVEMYGQANTFHGCRWENSGGDSHRRVWSRGTARLNAITRGIGVDKLTQVIDSGALPFDTLEIRNAPNGTTNTAFGKASYQLATASGLNNTALGNGVMPVASTAASDTGVGSLALAAVTTGGMNTGLGASALQNVVTGANNTAVGYFALQALTGNNATAIGQSAFRALTAGTGNVAVGHNTGYSPNGVTANATTTGNPQTLLGYQSGQASATQRAHVVAVGSNALVDGDGAIALGSGTLAGAAGAVAIGRDSAGTAASTTTADEIALGTALHSVKVLGKVKTAASSSTKAGLNVAHGAAPTTPADGDIWTTTSGMFVRVNGTTKTVTLT